MQVKLVIFPAENGLNVVVWGKWVKGSMRTRHFDNRSEMVATLKALGLINPGDGEALDGYVFTDSCPLYSAEVDEELLVGHGFELA